MAAIVIAATSFEHICRVRAAVDSGSDHRLGPTRPLVRPWVTYRQSGLPDHTLREILTLASGIRMDRGSKGGCRMRRKARWAHSYTLTATADILFYVYYSITWHIKIVRTQDSIRSKSSDFSRQWFVANEPASPLLCLRRQISLVVG